MLNEKPRCKDCIYCGPHPRNVDCGLCRINPPVMVNDTRSDDTPNFARVFPIVHLAIDWCAEGINSKGEKFIDLLLKT
jgi:hypothetical protein